MLNVTSNSLRLRNPSKPKYGGTLIAHTSGRIVPPEFPDRGAGSETDWALKLTLTAAE